LFGFELTRKDKTQSANGASELNKTFAIPAEDDGAVTIQSTSHYGTYVDLDGVVRNEIELITRYRQMAMQPELETAIDEVTNEAIITEDNGKSVELNTEELKHGAGVKKKILEEFEYILKLLNFGNTGHDTFRRWYVDGRLFYHVVIDEDHPEEGIKELRYIDPRRIRKIREIKKVRDPKTGIEIIDKVQEYYLYNERGIIGAHSNMGTKIATDSIININSGLMDSKRSLVLSYLHKAIKPLNQVRMVEDATVIYRLSRAPERRIFYVDVGNMPTVKADQYLRDVMVKYRNKLVYDSTTGEIRDDRKHLSMLEDIWLPRREGSQGTKIETLPGGENLGKMEDVEYFEKKLYKSLGVPVSRLDQNQGGGSFNAGRTTEITRDEMRFAKFISRIRNKFSTLFDDALRIQLVLKNITTEEDWREIKEQIWYDFIKDNNFDEWVESEIVTNRMQIVAMADPFVGKYFSKKYIRQEILKQSDDDYAEETDQMNEEAEEDAAAAQQAGVGPDGEPVPGAEEDPNAGGDPAQQGMAPAGAKAGAPQVENSKFEIQSGDMIVS
jgi:hypothetical protein